MAVLAVNDTEEDEDDILINTISTIIPDAIYQSGSPLSPDKESMINKLGISYVVNLYGLHHIRTRPGYLLTEITYPFTDGRIQPSDMKVLHELAKTVGDRILDGDKVLIRCQMGLNRSSLLTSLVLHRLGFPGNIVSYLRDKRDSFALCNRYFEQYVIDHVNANPSIHDVFLYDDLTDYYVLKRTASREGLHNTDGTIT